MDKREAIRIFIKRNHDIFTSDPFPSELFKKTKRDFFVQYAKVGVPKDSEIAEEILEIMINSSQIRSDEELDRILQIPFFSDNMHNGEYYHQKLSMNSVQKRALLDISSLGREEYQKQIRDEAKKEVLEQYDQDFKKKEETLKEELARLDEDFKKKEETLKEELARLDEDFKKKEEEYKSLPSILDNYADAIPEETSADPDDKEDKFILWWKELDLKDDPFPILEGFANISKDLYEKVVYRTTIFNKYESLIQSAPQELYKNTVFYGDFGSGKTTLFDYLRIKIGMRKIIPIYIQLYGAFDVHSIVISFRTKLLEELAQIYRIKTGQNLPSLDTDTEKGIKQILSELTKRYEVEGFVIFIDELHKGDLENALQFIGLLQAFKSEIINRLSFINIGFMIAGSLDWEKRISNDTRYSGSVTREERMPPVTIDAAQQALNLRLQAFANNPDNPRKIDKAFVEKIYKRLEVSGQPLNFRHIIRSILYEFEAGHFDALTVNPVKIPQGTLNQIKIMLESNPRARQQLNKLLHGSHGINSSQKTTCLKYLIEIFRSHGIYDREIKSDEAPYYAKLDQTNLISKVVINKQLYWVLSPAIDRVCKDIMLKFNLSLENYLLKIYGNVEAEDQPKIQVGEIEIMNEFLNTIPKDSMYNLLALARNSHSEIVNSHIHINSNEDAIEIISRCSHNLTELTKAYLLFERYPLLDNVELDENMLSFWDDFWFSPEELQQYIRVKNTDETELQKLCPLALGNYRESFLVLFKFLKEQFDKSRQIRIPLMLLKNEEIKELNDIRDYFIAAEYYQTSAKLAKLVEKKLRNFLFNVFTLLYGERDSRINHLDDSSRDYIVKNTSQDNKAGFGYSTNEFQHLNRGQYKNLMTGIQGSVVGRQLWLHIFSRIFVQWSERDMYDYLDLFAEINKKVSHYNEDSIGIDQQGIVYSFVIKSIEFLKRINDAYVRLFSTECFKLHGSNIRFSYCEFKDENLLTNCEITVEEVKRLWYRIKKDPAKVALDDQDFIKEYFGINYRNFIGAVALLANQTDEQLKKTKMKVMIDKKRNPDIRIVAVPIA